ncbi:MAG: YicC/YloC family endoribonuclease [Balneolaceae bacterium]
MITSMTGFGRGEASADGLHVTVEIKTLNSRYLDISIRLPQSLQHKEFDLKEIIQNKLSRGKINVNVNVDKSQVGIPDITFSPEMVKSYSKLLEDMRKTASITGPVAFHDLLRFEDIFVHRQEDPETLKKIWRCTIEAAHVALELVNKMRKQEGNELKQDLENQLTDIAALLEKISAGAQINAAKVKEKIQNRISEMVHDEKIDPDRLELEVALLIDKMDVNEEIVRLKSHIKFFKNALDSEDNVGRRLNFLCQEINRELNTIGSKSSDFDIAHHVVIGKEKLEHIREQVQNIE